MNSEKTPQSSEYFLQITKNNKNMIRAILVLGAAEVQNHAF